ncbi:hypothetical protein ACV3NC_14400 [Clostridium perfringens]
MENLTLDFNNFGSRSALGTYEKCDSLTLNIVLDEKDYAGYKFKIVAKKSDGHIIEQDIKEQDINREERIIKTELNNQFTTKEGVVKLEINMIKDGKEDTTKEAFFIVRDTINGEVVESTSIIPTLEGVKAFIDEAVISLGDLEQAGEDIALINGEFKEAEIKRKANELLRERSEKERVRLESVRTTEEADRIKAEAERKEAENNRKVAESNRKLAENTRKTNEAARVEAELNRQSLFEENEEIRNENENLRIEAEKERKLTFSNNNKFESERVEAEKLRAIAEDKRVTAEKARAKAEEERVKAETRRENTYTDFNDSEVERKNNEANRVRAEAERVNAESGRNELFNSNEEKRNSTFIESERTRERAFNEAQSNRNEAYEESERVREEAFKVSEATRNEAEEGRVAAELLRVEAEKLRVAGEENRNNTFTQSEEERKGVFEEAENTRKVAESKRVKTESSRVEAEKLRVSAETGRVEAESLRVTAEEKRVAAETKREEGFNKFEGRISANTEELKNARSATTGEKFDTLDERIDCEVDRLNKKIAVSFLHQEDKESHVVENTVEGMSTDMVIKGRILINIHPKSIYKFNAPSSEANKYTQDKSENSVIANITEEIASWCYVNCGAVNRNMLKPNTKYTVAGEFKGIESIVLMDGAGQYSITNQATISDNRAVVQTKSLEEINKIPSETRIIIYCYNEKTVGTVSAKNAMILEGDWTNKPIPQYFEGIKSFGQEENKISALSHGANIVNLSDWERKENVDNKECWVGDGYLSAGVTSGNPIVLKLTRQVKKNDKVTIISNNKSTKYFNKFQLFNSKTNKTQDVGKNDTKNSWINSKYTINAEDDYDYIQVNTGGIGAKSYIETLFVGIGTYLDYKPYQSNKKDILLSEYGLDEGLRGLNNSIYDELNDIKDVAIKRIGKSLIDETMEFHIETQNDTHISFYTEIKGMKPDALYSDVKAQRNSLSSNMPWIKRAWDVTDNDSIGLEGYAVSNADSRLYIRVKKSSLSSPTVESFKELVRTWKENGSPFILYYELINPIETPLDESIALKVFNEKTYVSFENTISGTSSFKAPVNAAATISRLNRENRALEEENAKLKAETYKNAEDIIITNEELQITQSAVDHLLFSNLNASGTAMLYNGKKKGGGSMGAYLAMRIIKGKLKYEAVMKQYGEFKEDIDLILEAEGYGHLITQQ